ncbi:MAG: LysR family transcriptional regulator, partial [Methylobacteriaceae bacterium]
KSTLLAERELASGRLVAPLAERASNVEYTGHYLVFPALTRRRTPLCVFARWLAAELRVALPPELPPETQQPVRAQQPAPAR